MVFGNIGLPELILILALALIIFGPKKLPEMGKALGSGIREFRNATRQLSSELKEEEEKGETKTAKNETRGETAAHQVKTRDS